MDYESPDNERPAGRAAKSHIGARSVRRRAARSGRMLWARLKAGRMSGLAFRRRHAIGCYTVDFFSRTHKIAIEIDVGNRPCSRRRAKEEFLKSIGIEVLRFTEQEIQDDLALLVTRVAEAVRRRMRGW